ncbi:MAG: hypothetical protein K0S89_718 [Nitrososphaeraceae archaeon]|jgi:hypothetical protein|nr:hypothetical protein [Nitrososphaeraceae archaeon]
MINVDHPALEVFRNLKGDKYLISYVLLVLTTVS